jgi:BirA family biotin operon repressor/biotin-[acetyl-CoA-carboxylase] ligase
MRTVMVCSLAIVDAIEDTTALQAQVKWPNDVLIGDRKVAGLLAEMGVTDDHLHFVVVGIGLNVNVEFDDGLTQYPSDSAPDTSQASLNVLASRSTSLLTETGRRVPRVDLLQTLLRAVEKRYEALRAGVIPNAEWSRRLAAINQMVTVTTADEVVTGQAEGVDADGALMVRVAGGRRRRVLAGDVTLRNMP